MIAIFCIALELAQERGQRFARGAQSSAITHHRNAVVDRQRGEGTPLTPEQRGARAWPTFANGVRELKLRQRQPAEGRRCGALGPMRGEGLLHRAPKVESAKARFVQSANRQHAIRIHRLEPHAELLARSGQHLRQALAIRVGKTRTHQRFFQLGRG